MKKTLVMAIFLGMISVANTGCYRTADGYLLPLEPSWGYCNNTWSYYGGWNTWNNNYYGSSTYGSGTIYWSQYNNGYGGVFLPAGCNSTCGLQYQHDSYYYDPNGYHYPIRYFGY